MGRATVLLLGGAAHSQGRRCLEQAQQRGLATVLADRPENLAAMPELVASADAVAELDYADPAACVAWAVSSPLARRLVGVSAFREYAVAGAAAVSERLGLPGNPVEAVATIRDKHRCREALRRLGFPQPAGALCAEPEDAGRFAAADGPGPWVVKPTDRMGSQGVTRVASADAAVAAAGALRSAGHHRVRIERWVAGEEFSVEGTFVDGRPEVLALTRKHLAAGSLVELGHALPAEPGGDRGDAVREQVRRALEALGLVAGAFHVEVFVGADDVVLGEVHARPGGDYIHWLVELVTGVQTYGALYDQMLGHPVERVRPRVRAGAVCSVIPAPGAVRALGDLDAVRADPSCLRLLLDVAPGDVVTPLRNSFDRAGFVVASGDGEAQAWARARALATAVTDRVEISARASA